MRVPLISTAQHSACCPRQARPHARHQGGPPISPTQTEGAVLLHLQPALIVLQQPTFSPTSLRGNART